jgi:SNF2 family DNA or RNA helicase
MLREYQKEAANFLWNHPRAALFLGCGYGKTLICLAVMDLLIKRGLVKTIVLIAPPAVLKTTWQDEAKKWGYEQVIPHIHFVSNCNTKTLYAEYDLMVVDELSAFKDTGTNRFRIAKKTKCKRFIGLTGTPVGNGLADLYGQMKLIIPAWYNKSQFMDTYFTPALQNGYIVYKWAPRPNAEVNIFENIKDYCFRVDATIELPEISYQVDNVVLPSNMLARYKKFKQDLLLELKEDTITAAN